MVTFGGLPSDSAFTRVSSVLSSNIFLAGLRRTQGELLRVQEQISTGLRILRTSDDPIGANRVLDFTRGLQRNGQFARNVETAAARISFSDHSLDQTHDLVSRAREIMLAQGQSTATAQSRQQAAREVTELLRRAVTLGNSRLEGRFLFGGGRTGTAPFVEEGGRVAFRGDLAELQADISDGLRAPTNITADAFGALSAEIRGIDLTTFLTLDLNPDVALVTLLADLNRGGGVAAGSIQVTGTGTASIDLGIARTLGDVVDLVNARSATTGVTASIAPGATGLRLTRVAPGAIVVQEVAGGRTAADLGILTAAGGVPSPLDGTNLDPILSPNTTVNLLRGGLGLSAFGITITQTSPSQTLTAVIGGATFAATSTVGQILNAINSSGLDVEARINPERTAIDVVSRLSGARLTISENGGATASQLGLLSTLRRARLLDLNNGNGLGTVEGIDLRITKKNGQVLSFDVDAFATVNDFVLAVNADPQLTATVNATNQIVISDTTAGAGTLQILNVNGSFAATNLGIAASAAGTPATITGTALTFAGVRPEGVFTALLQLRDALEADDTQRILSSGRLLDAAEDLLLEARGDAGVRLSSLELAGNRLEQENLELELLRSSTRDLDFAEAATRLRLQQTVLEASLASASRVLQTSLFSFLR